MLHNMQCSIVVNVFPFITTNNLTTIILCIKSILNKLLFFLHFSFSIIKREEVILISRKKQQLLSWQPKVSKDKQTSHTVTCPINMIMVWVCHMSSTFRDRGYNAAIRLSLNYPHVSSRNQCSPTGGLNILSEKFASHGVILRNICLILVRTNFKFTFNSTFFHFCLEN